jgi:hypothetical protein
MARTVTTGVLSTIHEEGMLSRAQLDQMVRDWYASPFPKDAAGLVAFLADSVTYRDLPIDVLTRSVGHTPSSIMDVPYWGGRTLKPLEAVCLVCVVVVGMLQGLPTRTGPLGAETWFTIGNGHYLDGVPELADGDIVYCRAYAETTPEGHTLWWQALT